MQNKKGKRMKTVKILGTNYRIEYKTRKEDLKLENVDGYCDFSIKKIVCIKRLEEDKDLLDLADLSAIDKRILRHEILHAFIYESGLWTDSFSVQNWGTNEEMTDWFAIQTPKIFEVYKELKILN